MSNFSISINYGFFMDEDDRFRLVKEAGFKAVGLWWGRQKEWFKMTAERQFELAEKYDLAIDYIHAPFDFHNHLRSDDEKVRREGINEHKKWIDECARHNVTNLVLHLNRLTKDEYITENLLCCLEEINEYAVNKKVKLALENIGRPYDLKIVFDRIKDIYFCFDSSHASLEGDREGKILQRYIDRVVCLHLSDNDGIADRHWPVGKGIIQFDKIVKVLKDGGYKGRINCEVVAPPEYLSPEEFLADLYKRMQQHFGDF